MREEPVVIPPDALDQLAASVGMPAVPSSPAKGSSAQNLADVPEITFLTHNHRSTKSILDMANSVLDIVIDLFPDKVDKLPREVSRVASKTPPVILSGLSFDEAMNIIFSNNRASVPADQAAEGQSQPASSSSAAPTSPIAPRPTAERVLEFGAKQAVLVWSEAKKKGDQLNFQAVDRDDYSGVQRSRIL